MISALKSRWVAYANRVYDSLSEIEREDVEAFDRWFARRGWLWVAGIIAATTLAAWVASQMPWNLSFLGAAVWFNGIVLGLVWSGLITWFGHRKFTGPLFRYFVLVPLIAFAGAFAFVAIAGWVQGLDPLDLLQDSTAVRHFVIGLVVFGVLFGLVTVLIVSLRTREYRALTAHLEVERRQSELSRQLAESRLRLLQLQIEPHFLFNTLGSAQQLAERGAPEAARLIANLIRFLRAATPTLRDETTTLGQEALLVEAYLGIMKTRLGHRLAFAVSIPDALRDAPLAPGMLITLVENAIKHGIEPQSGGGRIEVSAKRDHRSRLVLTVTDTGAGLSTGTLPGQGIGLANVRERLALLHGNEATLELEANEPRGFVARITLPPDDARGDSLDGPVTTSTTP